MFISRKKYEEAIKEAQHDVIRRYEEEKASRDKDDCYFRQFREIDLRLRKAFIDIDKRLTDLEKQKTINMNDVCCDPKY